jgi:hypothetical protein
MIKPFILIQQHSGQNDFSAHALDHQSFFRLAVALGVVSAHHLPTHFSSTLLAPLQMHMHPW